MTKTQAMLALQHKVNALPFAEREAYIKADPDGYAARLREGRREAVNAYADRMPGKGKGAKRG